MIVFGVLRVGAKQKFGLINILILLVAEVNKVRGVQPNIKAKLMPYNFNYKINYLSFVEIKKGLEPPHWVVQRT